MASEPPTTWALIYVAIHKRQVIKTHRMDSIIAECEDTWLSALRSDLDERMLPELASGFIKLEALAAHLDKRVATCKPLRV